ncbi:MAG TPA: Flp pilus assembly protein CpaB [Nocardioidaceae bacterium]|nr:Flp pilus assembly protein CpaB [Nocardioidaceae bacterium]
MPSALALTTDRVRRAISARRRLLAAGCAAAAAAGGLHTVSPPPPETTEVIVAAADLPAGVPVRAEQLQTVALRDGVVPDGALTTDAEAVGELLVRPVRAGEPLTDLSVVGAPLVRGYGSGRVAAPVRIADAGAVALLEAGDRIDVLAADPRGVAETAVVASGALVVVVPEPAEAAAHSGGALVVLAVTPEIAKKLSQAAVVGPLSLAIRG